VAKVLKSEIKAQLLPASASTHDHTYGPDTSVLDGSYRLLAVQRVS
jgi:hypothetical protein